MVHPSQTPMDEPDSAAESGPAPPAKPRLTFGISTLKDAAPAPAPVRTTTRPATTPTRPRPSPHAAPATNPASASPAVAMVEAALRVAVAQRMAQRAQATLAELQRQHPTIPVPVIDPERMDGAAAQALADPALATRLRLLTLRPAPPAAAAETPPAADGTDRSSVPAADGTAETTPEPDERQAGDEATPVEGDAIVGE